MFLEDSGSQASQRCELDGTDEVMNLLALQKRLERISVVVLRILQCKQLIISCVYNCTEIDRLPNELRAPLKSGPI